MREETFKKAPRIVHFLILLLLPLVVLTGCAAIPRSSPPALMNIEVETLTNSGDPAEMTTVAARFATYSAPLDKQLAAFKLAQRAYLMDRSNRATALVLSRSALILCGLLVEEENKFEVIRKGFESSIAAGGEGEDPEAAYYYGTLLGLLIEEEGITAAGEVPRFEEAIQRALKKPETGIGGPLRALGMLYLRAPAWPTGVGDLDKSLEFLARAAREFPSHPENHLFYAYALEEDDRIDQARDQLKQASGAISNGEWGDYTSIWQKEIEKFRKELDN
jgi:tetratricopeptide (TPR) repeat protein